MKRFGSSGARKEFIMSNEIKDLFGPFWFADHSENAGAGLQANAMPDPNALKWSHRVLLGPKGFSPPYGGYHPFVGGVE